MSEDTKGRLKSFPGGGKPNELAEALRDLRAAVDVMQETQKIEAKLLKHKYDALCENGFTPEQALELCKMGLEW